MGKKNVLQIDWTQTLGEDFCWSKICSWSDDEDLVSSHSVYPSFCHCQQPTKWHCVKKLWEQIDWHKKMGLTTSFGHFSKWPPQNLRFPISRKLLRVGSWFGGLNLYFLGQESDKHIRQHVRPLLCVLKDKNHWKNPRWPPIPHCISVNVS